MMAASLTVSPLVAALTAAVGIALILASMWISAVDVSLSRMTLAFVQDLEEEGRRGATTLAEAVRLRRFTALQLLVPRAITLSLGSVLATVPAFIFFLSLGWVWWIALLLAVSVVALLELGALLALAWLMTGERYVWVGLAGAPLARKLLQRARAIRGATAGSAVASASSLKTSPRLAVIQELNELVDEVSEGELPSLDKEDREILRSVFELGQTRVGEVMVPRTMMVVVKGDATPSEAVELFLQSGFSRLPVIGKNTDDVLGVLYLKDVVRRLYDPHLQSDVSVVDVMRPAAFVPEMKLADDELRVMQETNSHLALVVDEYGGIAGIVTAEDILEELVGELTDEHDRAAQSPEKVGRNTWNVPASYSSADLEDLLGVKIDEQDVYSIGGLLGKLLGRVPLPGDRAEVGSLELTAGQDVGRRRQVRTIKVKVLSEPETENPGRSFFGEGGNDE